MSDSLIARKEDAQYEMKNFKDDEKQRITDIAKDIDIEDASGVITYGVGAQKEISSFADATLSQIREKDTGYVGDILTDMMVKIKDLKVDSIGTNKGILSQIPILNAFVHAVKKFIAQYEKVSVHIERIIEELDKARVTLLKDISMLDNMYETNLQYLRNLDFFIAAGMLKLKELTEKTLPEMRAQADASNDPKDSQRVADFTQAINRFEKKIHDLKLSRLIAIQTAPQIRLIQGNNQALVEKIQSSILNTIPLWKNQIVIAISLFRQKKSLELQKEVSKTTNELLSKNAELLKQSSLDIARENERGIVEVETLKKVNSDLITTIEETLKIQAEGREKRQAAEAEILRLEGDLKTTLKNVGR
jgi:uncharacterized protein YaaN involved in tellurite resistance